MSFDPTLVNKLRNYITDQVFLAFGFQEKGWARKWLWPVFWPPAHLFSRLAAHVDHEVEEYGIVGAMRRLLPRFVHNVLARGKENIPSEGPLLVASNHPGTIDSVAISASLDRPDLKIVATGIPFLRELPAFRQHLVYVSKPQDTFDRMMAVRSSIRHLEQGGALLIFPSGGIDPDPSFLPGAEDALGGWSPSLEVFLRKVPQTRVLVTIISGVLAPSCMRNPLVHLRKDAMDQRRLAEFLQVMQQMFIPRSFHLTPRISFSKPLSVDDLRVMAPNILRSLIHRAQQVLNEHLNALSFRTLLP